MEIYEITGFQSGISREGVNYLEPADSFQNIQDGFIHRQILQSRPGFTKFSKGYDAGAGPTGRLQSRVYGIFQHILTATSTNITLACDSNNLYRYNNITDEFDLIPFGGSLAGYPGFNLVTNDDYISGTTYPFKDGSERFIFTGKGMNRIFMYDGTNVLDFTSAVDNPDYQQFATGNITKAWHVFWFGERLNFVAPTIGGTFYPQGMLYSGIRDSSGKGDKFNVAGSGLLQIDTYEHVKGAKILGDRIGLNATKSNWMIEKTSDVFNPYFSRKISGEIGTDSPFSTVVWNDEMYSVGKTGVIASEGRQTLRIDNKIPYFTRDEMSSNDFDLLYGGFDRFNSQFLWSFLGDRTGATQDSVLVYNYEEKSWSVNKQRFSCFGEATTGINLSWDDINSSNNVAWGRWDTTHEIWDRIGIGEETQKTLAGDDVGFIYELNRGFGDYFSGNFTGITKATNAVITLEDHAFKVGDEVYIDGVSGMTQINGSTTLVKAVTTNTVTVGINSSTFDSWTSGGYIVKYIKFSAETVPFNPYRSQGRKCFISHIEFLIDTNGGNVRLDLFMDGISEPFKEDVLLQPDRTDKDRQWVAVQVNNIADFMVMKMKQNSVDSQVRITSIRIHCEPAEETVA